MKKIMALLCGFMVLTMSLSLVMAEKGGTNDNSCFKQFFIDVLKGERIGKYFKENGGDLNRDGRTNGLDLKYFINLIREIEC